MASVPTFSGVEEAPLGLIQYAPGFSNASGDLKLFQLPEDMQRVLKEGDTLQLKGTDGDELVLCTANETFDVRMGETSNTLLLVRPAIAEDNATPGVSLIIEGLLGGVHELKRIVPGVHRVREVLRHEEWDNPQGTLGAGAVVRTAPTARPAAGGGAGGKGAASAAAAAPVAPQRSDEDDYAYEEEQLRNEMEYGDEEAEAAQRAMEEEEDAAAGNQRRGAASAAGGAASQLLGDSWGDAYGGSQADANSGSQAQLPGGSQTFNSQALREAGGRGHAGADTQALDAQTDEAAAAQAQALAAIPYRPGPFDSRVGGLPFARGGRGWSLAELAHVCQASSGEICSELRRMGACIVAPGSGRYVALSPSYALQVLEDAFNVIQSKGLLATHLNLAAITRHGELSQHPTPIVWHVLRTHSTEAARATEASEREDAAAAAAAAARAAKGGEGVSKRAAPSGNGNGSDDENGAGGGFDGSQDDAADGAGAAATAEAGAGAVAAAEPPILETVALDWERVALAKAAQLLERARAVAESRSDDVHVRSSEAFLSEWHSEVCRAWPDGTPPQRSLFTLALLKTLVLFDAPGPGNLTFFPESELPHEPAARCKAMFAARRSWKEAHLVAFLEPLAQPPHCKLTDMIAANCRVTNHPDKTRTFTAK